MDLGSFCIRLSTGGHPTDTTWLRSFQETNEEITASSCQRGSCATVWWRRQWRICLQCRRPKFPWRREWQSTPVFLLEKSHGLRSLAGYTPWSLKESDLTEWLSQSHIHIHGCKRSSFMLSLNSSPFLRTSHSSSARIKLRPIGEANPEWKEWDYHTSHITTVFIPKIRNRSPLPESP